MSQSTQQPGFNDDPKLNTPNATSVQRSSHAVGATITKIAAAVVAAIVLVACVVIGGRMTPTSSPLLTTSADNTIRNTSFETAREHYGLTEQMGDGAILHAWMWSFNTIKDNMADIAAAGYTSVQTEPMSAVKTVAANGKKFTNNWYYVYQPTDTTIGNFVVGTEDDLKAMTQVAHEYGVRVIVDVVVNHFTSDWSAIAADWQDPSLFHSRKNCGGENGDGIDYSNREQVTQCHLLGLWDINTQNQTTANRMQSFLKQAVADGVDGFRFDASKHVELPNEFSTYSPYWDTILNNGAQFQYGEVLQGDSTLPYADYAALFNSRTSNGGAVTASAYGTAVRKAITSKIANVDNLTDFYAQGVPSNQLVTWVESHDNYANTDHVSTWMTNDQIKQGWVLVAARDGGAPLYFNRPQNSGGSTMVQFAETSQLGDAGDDMWKDPTIVAVNHFHNQMAGESEYLRNCQDQTNCVMVERYASDGSAANDGVAIANMSKKAIDLTGSATTLDDGTYTDQVNGGTITVANGTITSGSALANAVSVFYNPASSTGTATTSAFTSLPATIRQNQEQLWGKQETGNTVSSSS